VKRREMDFAIATLVRVHTSRSELRELALSWVDGNDSDRLEPNLGMKLLAALGPDAAAAAPEIAQRLGCVDYAKQALLAIGPEAVPHAVHALAAVAGEAEDPLCDALAVLQDLGPAAEEALPILLDRVMDAQSGHNHDYRLQALHAIRDMGRCARAARPILVRLFAEREEPTWWRVAVARVLRALGGPERTDEARVLAIALDADESTAVRVRAAAFCPHALPAREVLFGLLHGAGVNQDSRALAAAALTREGLCLGETVPLLFWWLRHDGRGDREPLWEAIESVPRGVPGRDSELVNWIAHTDALRAARDRIGGPGSVTTDLDLAAHGLAGAKLATYGSMGSEGWCRITEYLGAAAAAAIPDLREKLNSGFESHADAARALGYIGSPAAAAIADLDRILHDEPWPARREAALALGRMGPNGCARVAAALDESNLAVRLAALLAVGDLGPAAVECAPGVCAALRDPRWRVRRFAVRALGALAAGDAELRELLGTMQADPVEAVRRATMEEENALSGE